MQSHEVHEQKEAQSHEEQKLVDFMARKVTDFDVHY
jgi:hypothetical protein